MSRGILVILFASSFAPAGGAPPVRVCIGPFENRSSYQFPIDKGYFASELSHHHVKAINIGGEDIAGEMSKNNCDYLVRGEFTDYVSLKPGEVVNVGGIVVDGRKRFALRFKFDLRRAAEGEPVYSDQDIVIDKNPKTCADDNVYDAAHLILDWLKNRQ